MIHSVSTEEPGADRRDAKQTHAGGESDDEGRQHHHRVLRVLDLGAIANQVGGTGNAERTCQARRRRRA